MSGTHLRYGRGLLESQVPELLTVDDLARLLRVPKATIYRWRTTGDGPRGYVIGRYVRFRRAEVEAWLEERADEPGPERS
jgi:excisionase family DNA binding protein